jgi:hypothetical protein
MAEFSGSLPDKGFFFVNGVTPFQERVFDKIRLPEKVKALHRRAVFRPFHAESDNIALRLPVQNTVVFKGGIAENGKPVGTPPPLVD